MAPRSSYGIPGDTPAGLAWAIRVAPGLRFVQATAAGAGEQVRAAQLSAAELDRVAIASASGVHAVPLADGACSASSRSPRAFPASRREQPRARDH